MAHCPHASAVFGLAVSLVGLKKPRFTVGFGCYLYLYLFFGVDDSIVDDFTKRGDHSSGPMRNPKLTGVVM